MAYNWESGMILFFDVACPSAWTNISAYNGKYIKMTTSIGAIGDTGGNSNHRHTVDPGSQNSGFNDHETNINGGTIGGLLQSYGHRHPVNPSSVYTDYNDNNPAYLDMILCKKD